MDAGLPASAFTSSEIVQRDVTLGDGSTHTLSFKEASSKAWRRYWVALASARDDDEDDRFERAVAGLIAESLVDDDGASVMTVEKARTLKFEVQQSIVKVLQAPPKPGKD